MQLTDKQLQAAEREYYPHDDNHARDMRTAFENGVRWAMAQQKAEERKAENAEQRAEGMQAAPAPSGDVIERMKAAHLKAVHAHNMTRTDGGFNGETCFHLGMTAAYKVATAGMVSLDAVMVAIAKEWTAPTMECSEFQSRIRARLEAKPKTAEDHIHLRHSHDEIWEVWDDRKPLPHHRVEGEKTARFVLVSLRAEAKENSNARAKNSEGFAESIE